MEKRGGPRRKSRHVFRKKKSEKGKFPITKYLKQFNVGDRVVLKADSSYQKSLYHRRFHGLSGIVMGKTGRCYEVGVKDGNKLKCIIIHPVHLKEQ